MVLRPQLYDRLEARFQHVLVANEGQEMIATYERDALTRKPTLRVKQAGEYYRINCPFCYDTRKRLYINHRWGLQDPHTGSKNLWLAYCFNEQCLKNEIRQKYLYGELFADVGDGTQDVLIPSNRPATPEPVKFEWPGEMVPLHQLHDYHPACRYLCERGFDPEMLSRQLGVSYCTQGKWANSLAAGRIVVPITMNGKLQGWQARYIGNPPNQFVPKYCTMPGMKVKDVLYNLDYARNYPHVVLVEGVTDVWKVGPASVALFGKTLSATQELLITSIWNQGTVYVMLDSDAADDARKIVEKLRGRVGKCVLVELPDDRDPGDLSQQELRQRIEEASSKETLLV